MKMLKRQSGFSLIEIMVVLLIIGILASMVAPQILGNQEEAQLKKAAVDIQQLESALEMYKLHNFRYPTSEQGMEALIQKPTSAPEPKNYQVGGYLKGGKLPQDAWGNEFLYFSDKGQYEIISLGSDGAEGGEGDAADISSQEL